MSRPVHFFPETPWRGKSDSNNVVVWLPAFGDSGTMTSRPYIAGLRRQGWSVLVINHHDVGFNMRDTVTTVTNELLEHPRDRVLLIGASFGVQILAELLRNSTAFSELQGKFSAISICGVSSGQDTHMPIGWAKHLHGPVSGAAFKLAQAAQISLTKGSPFDEKNPAVAAEIKPHKRFRKWNFSGQALLEQMAAMASTPPIMPDEFAGIPALIITTKGEDALLKPQAAINLARAFTKSWTVMVDLSIHADLTELPSQYGPLIWDFAEMIINTDRPH